jgi:ribosomal protein L16 Arg81 hydroxylase
LTDSTFNWLLKPISLASFNSEYFEKKHLLVKRPSPDYYKNLFTYSELNDCLGSQVFSYPDTRLIDNKRGGTIPATEYCLSGSNLIDPYKLLNGYEAGATVALAGLHKRHSLLLNLCSALETELYHKFRANVYLTPPRAKGFTPHWDTHDGFVLQLQGSKKWKIYGNDKPLALKSEEFKKEGYKVSAVTDEFTLSSGDLLYVPRGLAHDAETTDESSLHITLGLMGTTWLNHLQKALQTLANDSLAVRSYLPMSYASNLKQAAYEARVDQLLNDLREIMLDKQLIKEEGENALSNSLKFAPNQLFSIDNKSDLNLDSYVFRRLNTKFSTRNKGDQLIVQVFDSEIELPLVAADVFKFIAEKNKPFQIRQLPDIIDDDSKIFVAKKLISAGLLVFSR